MKAKLLSLISQCSKNKEIIYILTVSFILRFTVALLFGDSMFLYSDDNSYIEYGINFLHTGSIVDYSGYPTVGLMPGMPILMSAVFALFGYGYRGIFVLRTIFCILGTISIYGIYRIAALIFNKSTGYAAAILLGGCLPVVAMNNLILTETPFMFCLIFLTYYLIRFCREQSDRMFLVMLTYYLIGIMFKPTIGLYPLAFIPYMFYCRMPLRKMLLRGVYAGLVTILFLSPWWIRNYAALGEIVPFTGNQGHTLLLGTFQGEHCPEGDANAILQEINDHNSLAQTNGNPYFKYKLMGEAAQERISLWTDTAPLDYLYSCLILKPKISIQSLYYPVGIYNIKSPDVQRVYSFLLKCALIAILLIILENIMRKKFDADLCVVLGVLILLLTSAYFYGYNRYGLVLTPFILLLAAKCIVFVLFLLGKATKFFLIKND